MEFIENLKQIDDKFEKRTVNKDETVTSSKFVLNHREQHNIVDFLSANHSDKGGFMATIDSNVAGSINQQAMLIQKGLGANYNNSGPYMEKNQKKKGGKNMSGNPLLNDSMN
jgi:hypothetical protein